MDKDRLEAFMAMCARVERDAEEADKAAKGVPYGGGIFMISLSARGLKGTLWIGSKQYEIKELTAYTDVIREADRLISVHRNAGALLAQTLGLEVAS